MNRYQKNQMRSLSDKKAQKRQEELVLEIKKILLAAAGGVVLTVSGMTLGPQLVDLGKSGVEVGMDFFDEKQRDEQAKEIFTMLMNESGAAKRTENNQYYYYEHGDIAQAIINYVNWPLRNTENYTIEELLEAGMSYADVNFGAQDIEKIAELIEQKLQSEKENTLGGP